MHELAVGQSIIQSCRAEMKAWPARKAEQVNLEVGILSGVEPELLQTALEELKKDTVFSATVFHTTVIKAELVCLECHKVQPVSEPVFYCPSCYSPSVRVSRGDQLLIREIILCE